MKARFPIAVTKGGVTSRIHRAVQIQSGRRYNGYMVVYSLLGKRKRVWRTDLAEAEIAAEDACNKIANGEHLSLTLTNADRLSYLRACEALLPTGVKLDVAAQEYVSAIRSLPEGTTLREVVDFFRRRCAAAVEKRTTQQVVDELLAVKRTANLSTAHLNDLDSRLNRFARDFQMSIGDVSGKLIQAWLDAMSVRGRTKRNYLRCLAALFRFAIKRKYLPKDAIDEIEAVEQPKQDSDEVEIFTPDEMREILSAARPEMIPWLAIAGFAGLRSAEIARLDWSEVNLAERHIEIKASKAKTAARRLAPVTDNLVQWLAPYAKKSGNVVKFGSWWNQIAKLADAVNANRAPGKKFAWRHNGLRHSFCSYRLATIKNAAQVALEAGNSPQMIFKHYRQVVTEAEATKWFAIVPPRKKAQRRKPSVASV